MNNKSKTTGNTGEWSELYALMHILSNGGMYAADSSQNKIEDIFYEVIKAILHNQSGKILYLKDDKNITASLNGEVLGVVKQDKLRKILKEMFSALKEKNEGRAYELSTGEDALNLLFKNGIKASSSKKKDIDLVLLDIKTKIPTPETGFSIKSQLGSPSTLINASKATNFTFEVLDENGQIPQTIPKLHPKNVKDNIGLLLEEGYQLKLFGVDSVIFEKNLKLIDANLPEYLASILISYYSRRANKISDLVGETSFSDKNHARFKIKEFLSTMALGMMPNKEWDGILTTLGGFILVKSDGDVLCYYLYNLDEFREYLISITKLETPSTTRYGIGSIYQESGKYFLKLNLQVRFLK